MMNIEQLAADMVVFTSHFACGFGSPLMHALGERLLGIAAEEIWLNCADSGTVHPITHSELVHFLQLFPSKV